MIRRSRSPRVGSIIEHPSSRAACSASVNSRPASVTRDTMPADEDPLRTPRRRRCQDSRVNDEARAAISEYLDYTGRDDLRSGGARMIPIDTPSGPGRVWTKRIGNNPDQKVLLLHGGPGATHEYLEAFDSF